MAKSIHDGWTPQPHEQEQPRPDTVSYTRWSHPGWAMDLTLEGGPDTTRADTAEILNESAPCANASAASCSGSSTSKSKR